MPLADLLPAIRALPHDDKLRLMKLLADELAQDEHASESTDVVAASMWSPFDAYDAAATLLRLLKDDKALPS